MTSGKKKSINIKKYRSKRERNLGFLLFAIVFIYLIVTVVMYLTGDNISVYESTDKRNAIFIGVNTDEFRILYDIRNLLET